MAKDYFSRTIVVKALSTNSPVLLLTFSVCVSVYTILKSDFCGCFHCISIFPVADIKEMVVEKDGFKTAICPICGIDAVLGDASVEITAEILEVLNEHFF